MLIGTIVLYITEGRFKIVGNCDFLTFPYLMFFH